ncbi:MAG: maleylacetoacetate isomerase [Alphaproteobacteria bacterium]
MKLYTYWRSTAAYRVRVVLNLKGLEAEQIPVNLAPPASENESPDFLKINPAGKVPALELDDGRLLYQSLAIIDYLDETHPEPPLLPRDPEERAAVRAFAQTIACDVHPLNNIRVLKFLWGPMGVDRETVTGVWYPEWIRSGLTALEETLVRREWRGPFAFGGSVTLADVCLVPQLYNARRFEVDLGAYERLTRIEAECLKLEAFARAAPEVQPDAA